MRQKILRDTRRFLSGLVSLLLICSILLGNTAFAFISGSGSTKIVHNEEREIAKGVVWNKWHGVTSDGKTKVGHTITFNPLTSDAFVMAAYGYNVNSRVTLSSSSYLVEQEGVKVIGGINGDFYYVETGIPIGMMIQNGRLVSYSTTKWNAIGFREDGTVHIGEPLLEMQFTVNGKTFGFNNFNKSQNDWGPYLYSQDFGPNTGSSVPSIEVVLDIFSGEIAVGKTVTATVSQVKTNAKSTPIGQNQLVLSARNEKMGYEPLKYLKPGDVVEFSFKDVTGQWSNVSQAIGGEKILINNGVIQSGLSTTDYNPVSAIGVKANGDVVIFQADGRTTLSQGLSSYETARFLYDLGCVKAIKLDGGGSSAIIARMPGHKSPGLQNTPSDGKERANSNSLLLVSKRSIDIKNGLSEPGTEATRLHVYPKKTYALPKATVQYNVLATDDYYFATDVPNDVQWYTNAGTFDSGKRLKVTTGPGSYPVYAANDDILGSAELIILGSVTSLKPSHSVIYAVPGESVDLSCEAYYYNIKVAADDTSFTWKVEGNIGTISEDGKFTAANNAQAKGRIVVSYGNTSAYIDVVFPDPPDVIEDFESNSNWSASKEKAKSATASVIENKDIAKSGTKVLKVDYDFTLDNGVEKGIAGAYAYRVNPDTGEQLNINLSKDPAAIGMWVYGDNSRTWLRAQLKDGSGQKFYIDFTPEYNPSTGTGGIDWTGWKYVEAKIPSGRKGPFTIEMPVRIMCTRDDMRTKGTLYIDRIQAVYTASASDNEPPVINISPELNQSVINANKVSLVANLFDDRSGVDIKSIEVSLDSLNLPFNASVNTDGTVVLKSELGAELPLADGLHRVNFKYADNFGNKGTKTIEFTVDTGAPQIIASTQGTVEEGGTFTTQISVKNPKNLRKVYMDFIFDPSKVEIVDADPNISGKQIALAPGVKAGKIITHRIDEVNGRITLEIDNLLNYSTASQAEFGTITFKAKQAFGESTELNLRLGAMIVGQNPKSQTFALPRMKTSIDYDLVLTVTGTRAGEPTVFTLTDKNGNPVSGAGIYLNNFETPLFRTGDDGRYETRLLTQFPVGTELEFRCIKDGKKSNKVKVVITE